MKNKGFTLVELITTFALSAVLIILLINIIVIIKNLYSKSNIKTNLYINQSNLSNAMNKKINSDNLESYSECNDEEFCYQFNFYNGESIKLTISDTNIKFGSVVYKLDNNLTITEPSVSTEYVSGQPSNKNDSFLIIKIPVKHKLYPNIDFGINLVYPYNSNITSL